MVDLAAIAPGSVRLLFGWDPWGDLLEQLQEAAEQTFTMFFELVFSLSAVQLDSEWFRELYGGTLYVAIWLSFAFVLVAFMRAAMRQISASALLTILFRQVPIFGAIAFSAPTIAAYLAHVSASVSASILGYGAGNSAEDQAEMTLDNFGAATATLAGGSVLLTVVMLLGWLLALVGVALVVIAVGFVQYVAVIAFPLFYALSTSARHRGLAWKGTAVTIGLFLVLPAVAGVLAIVFRMFGEGAADLTITDLFGSSLSDSVRAFVLMAQGLFGLVVATAVPFLVTFALGSMVANAVNVTSATSALTGGTAAASSVAGGSAAGAARHTGASLGASAAGAAAGSVAPGAGTAAGAAAGKGAGASAAAASSTAGGAGRAAAGASSKEASNAAQRQAAGQLGRSAAGGAQQAATATRESGQSAVQATYLTQGTDENVEE